MNSRKVRGDMMKDIKCATTQYRGLQSIIHSFKGNFKELYVELKGFNLEENERFDVNYGCLVATIYNKNGFVLHHYVDIWDDEKGEHICEDYKIK